MCLILFSWKAHPKYKLIVAANRDEFYQRPTASAGFWSDYPEILAGKDLKAGGTWLGLEKSGHFAAVTNYRDLTSLKDNARSRGELTKDYLTSRINPYEYLKNVAESKDAYNGFNLIISDFDDLLYFSNIENVIKKLDEGIYGLSNHLLDSPWPKVENGKHQFMSIIQAEDVDKDALFQLLQNIDQPLDEKLPSTGVSLEWERALSSIFITTKDYGTYCSTVLLVDHEGNCSFEERTFSKNKGYSVKKHKFRLNNKNKKAP